MASKISVNLDTSKENYLVAKCKQNDDLRLEALIYENGLNLELTNKEISIQALKSDGSYIIQSTGITKENNKISVDLSRDFSRLAGTTKIEIVLIESGKQNTTFSFYLEVVASVIKGAVESKDKITVLEELSNKVIEAGVVKAETELLIKNGGAATKGDIATVNTHLEQNSKLNITINDEVLLGEELAKSSDWIVDGWTGNFNDGFIHTIGQITPLEFNGLIETANKKYRVSFYMESKYPSGQENPSSNFSISIGGSEYFEVYKGGGSMEFVFGVQSLQNGNFKIIPKSDFDGKITNISIKEILSEISPSYCYLDTNNQKSIEIRTHKSELNNLYIGKNCGKYSVEGGDKNIGVGVNALTNNMSGFWNTALGTDVLTENTTGSRNIAVGNKVLLKNTVGHRNVGIGTFCLESNTNGFHNIALGADTMYRNVSGNNNVAISPFSLSNNTTGQYNIGIGVSSLLLSNGNNNIAIGEQSQLKTNTSNNISIGRDSLKYTTEQNTIAIGVGSCKMNTQGRNISIGNQSLSNGTTGRYNVAIGYNSLNSNNGNFNIAIGDNSLSQNTTGENNISLGYNSCNILNTGVKNINIGNNSLLSNETGNNNISIGNESLKKSIKSFNISIGNASLFNNIDGMNNTSIGYSALKNLINSTNNTAIGHNCGSGSLASECSGSVFIGSDIAPNMNATSNNTIIGASAGQSLTTEFNNILIGKGADVKIGVNNFINLGNTLYGDSVRKKIGINIQEPQAFLHLPQGTATNGYAPLKFEQGILNYTPQGGCMEYDGQYLYFTTEDGIRKKIQMV